MDHQHNHETILPRLKRHHLARWLVFVGLCSIAWLVFLLLFKYYTPYAGAEWRYARFGFALSLALVLVGLVGHLGRDAGLTPRPQHTNTICIHRLSDVTAEPLEIQ